MTRRVLRELWPVLLLSFLLLACGSSSKSHNPAADGDTDGEAEATDGDTPGSDGDADFDLDQAYPASHTDVLGGTHHLPGAETARQGCVDCHGPSLGGLYGPSCYSCHDGRDHALLLGTHKHKAGSPATCARCHAPGGQGLATKCATCHGADSLTPPADHTETQGTTKHKPGKDDPLLNCVECHGKDLKGNFGKSCYLCHNSSNHLAKRGEVMHLAGAESSCVACHGPANKGGLGPACASCHGAAVHPASHTDNQNGAYHLPGKAAALANCAACHGSDLKGATGRSCYGCHTSADHTRFAPATPHRSGTNESCQACHGTENKGSLGRACSTCHNKAGSVAPTSHTDLQGSAKHLPGKEDALANCGACHGENLTGDLAKSCYGCHAATNHTINREGFAHRSGGESTCVACHGPANKGGLGPACLPCHMSHGDKRR